jgi:hypothetical protein
VARLCAAIAALVTLLTVAFGAPSASADVGANRPNFTVGRCVRNIGTTAKPVMANTPCRSGMYRILARLRYSSHGLRDCEARYTAANAAYSVYAYTDYYRGGRLVRRVFNPSRSYILCLDHI